MSRHYRIFYSPEALNDLKDIYSYIAYRLLEKDSAKKLIDRIRKEVKTLSNMPERYAAVDWEPWHSEGVRTLLVGNFIAYYRTDKDANTVLVGRILYAGRDVEGMARDLQSNPE